MTYTTWTSIGMELQSRLRGPVWPLGDDGYDTARRIWNNGIDHRPAAVACCLDDSDLRTALLVARERGMPLSVRGGGHDWAGRAIRDGGLVLDLSALRNVSIDPVAQVATAQGGALISDLIDPAAGHGLGTATGVVGDVGMAGLTMAGGYGGLLGHFGLALDNLLSARVMLADGRTVTASADEEPELFWALRGGGGNFGLVTEARYRLHRLESVLAGMLMYPLKDAGSVLHGYRELIASAPDELTVMAGFLTGPTGSPVVYLAPTWSGDLAAGEAVVASLSRFGAPLAGGLVPMSYPDLLRMFDAGMTPGNRYALGTRWLPDLTDDAISALVVGAATCPSPSSLIALHHFHGAASRVAPDATAFALRQDHLLAEVIGAWGPGPAGQDPEVTAAPHREWIDAVSDALAAEALPGGYPNILGPEDADRTKLGFAGNAGRLLAAKHRYDPDGVFTAVGAIS